MQSICSCCTPLIFWIDHDGSVAQTADNSEEVNLRAGLTARSLSPLPHGRRVPTGSAQNTFCPRLIQKARTKISDGTFQKVAGDLPLPF